MQEEAKADLQQAVATVEKERQAMDAAEPETGAATAKPCNNSAVIDSDSDTDTAAAIGGTVKLTASCASPIWSCLA